jgi:DNA-dependent RNA polymerase auxiliary subunit epsilon
MEKIYYKYMNISLGDKTMFYDNDIINFESSEFIPTDDTKILRYMNFPEFLYLLEYGKLYFTKVKLFEDKYEELIPGIAARVYKEADSGLSSRNNFLNEIENRTYINSWTEFNMESYAMWHIYSKKYGIAIETDCRKLKEIIKPFNGLVRKVKYIDINKSENMIRASMNKTDKEDFQIENIFTLKSRFYEYEKEIRAIFTDMGGEEYKEIKIEIGSFLNSIIISPFASRWFDEMVSDIVSSKYGLNNIKICISGVEIKEQKEEI